MPRIQEDLDRPRSGEATRLSGAALWLARAVWIALSLLGLGLFAISLPTMLVARGVPLTPVQAGLTQLGIPAILYVAYYLSLAMIFALVNVGMGALIAWRRSDDPMALFVSLFLVLWGTANGGTEHVLDVVHPGLHTLTMLALGVQFACLTILLFVFPDGQFFPRRSRLPVFAWSGVVLFLLIISPPTPDPDAGLLAFVGFLFGGLAQVFRYTGRSTPIQRQQTKWVSFAMVAQVLAIVLALVIQSVPFMNASGASALLSDLVSTAILTVAGGLIPVALAVAILRYRLWDIDIIVRRTMIYTLLTGALAATYVGTVVLLEQISRTVLGKESGLAIVGSTLAIAALFQPLRGRIQSFVDRQFYRHKYDATRVLASFGASLRDDVVLTHLTERLVAVTTETVQPIHVSLWLRPTVGPVQNGRQIVREK